jgi:ribosomal protein L11 methyltransferase
VGDFCYVRADFHESREGFQYEVLINPKQAFGTGHHETTYMMIESMREIQFSDKRVLDLGCGTGILAILAAKMGAQDIIALDIEEESVENTIENLALNAISADVNLGSVEVVAGQKFDVVLANINRNAIMFLMPEISKLLRPGGIVTFSGFLEANYLEVVSKAEFLKLSLIRRVQRGEWECLVFRN